METHLSASVGPILPAATLISGLLSWFSPLFFAEASPDPPPSLQPLHLLDTLPPAPRVSRRRDPFRAGRVKESETANEDGDGKEKRDDAAFRRIVLLKESDAKVRYLLSSFSLFLSLPCSTLLYTLPSLCPFLPSLSLSLSVAHPLISALVPRSLFIYARSVAHWKIYAVNYRPGNTTFESGNADTEGILSETTASLSSCLERRATDPPLFRSPCTWKMSVLCRERRRRGHSTLHSTAKGIIRAIRDCSFYRGSLEARADVARMFQSQSLRSESALFCHSVILSLSVIRRKIRQPFPPPQTQPFSIVHYENDVQNVCSRFVTNSRVSTRMHSIVYITFKSFFMHVFGNLKLTREAHFYACFSATRSESYS